MKSSIRVEGFASKERLTALGRGLLVACLLSGCSSVPDAINPVEWYKGATDLFTGHERPEIATPRAPQGQYPDVNGIAKTPPKPPAEGLAADRGNANYAGAVRREVAPTKPLVRRPAAPQESEISVAQLPAPTAPSTVAAQARLAGARSELGPQSPPSQAPNMIPPARPDIPDQVASAGQRPRGQRGVEDQYRRRLNESAATSVPVTEVITPAALVASDSDRVRLVPPSGGRGKGMSAPLPKAQSTSSFQVAAVDFGGSASGLTAQDRKALASVAQLYRQTGGVIRIVGSAPDSYYGGPLAIQRANRVAEELTRLGVPVGKLFVGAGASSEGTQVYLEY